MPVNYDNIARVYDLLSRVIFGNSIVKAQVCLLKYIPANSHVLIAGGGTGWILEELVKQHPTGLTIDYVEVSQQMIMLSKKRNCGTNVVNFINLPIENFTGAYLYDAIFTPFVLDNFTPDKTEKIFARLHDALKSRGIWLYVDFVYDKNKSPLWQKLLLKVMYFFFRVTCGIETDELVNTAPLFSSGYQKIFEAAYYFKFIRSVAWRKY